MTTIHLADVQFPLPGSLGELDRTIRRVQHNFKRKMSGWVLCFHGIDRDSSIDNAISLRFSALPILQNGKRFNTVMFICHENGLCVEDEKGYFGPVITSDVVRNFLAALPPQKASVNDFWDALMPIVDEIVEENIGVTITTKPHGFPDMLLSAQNGSVKIISLMVNKHEQMVVTLIPKDPLETKSCHVSSFFDALNLARNWLKEAV